MGRLIGFAPRPRQEEHARGSPAVAGAASRKKKRVRPGYLADPKGTPPASISAEQRAATDALGRNQVRIALARGYATLAEAIRARKEFNKLVSLEHDASPGTSSRARKRLPIAAMKFEAAATENRIAWQHATIVKGNNDEEEYNKYFALASQNFASALEEEGRAKSAVAQYVHGPIAKGN